MIVDGASLSITAARANAFWRAPAPHHVAAARANPTAASPAARPPLPPPPVWAEPPHPARRTKANAKTTRRNATTACSVPTRAHTARSGVDLASTERQFKDDRELRPARLRL